MAIVLQPQFPVPDRSRQSVRILKDESGMIDIGWCEGVLSDGRAFRAEMWAQDHVSSLTIFFSTLGLEALDPEEICALVEQEGLVSFEAGAESYCASDKYVDNSGQELWSVNIVVGVEQQTFVRDTVPIFVYSDNREPDTLRSALFPYTTLFRSRRGVRSASPVTLRLGCTPMLLTFSARYRCQAPR